MPSKLERKIPKVRTKPKPKGASIESHPKFITEANKKNDDYRKKVFFLFHRKAKYRFLEHKILISGGDKRRTHVYLTRRQILQLLPKSRTTLKYHLVSLTQTCIFQQLLLLLL